MNHIKVKKVKKDHFRCICFFHQIYFGHLVLSKMNIISASLSIPRKSLGLSLNVELYHPFFLLSEPNYLLLFFYAFFPVIIFYLRLSLKKLMTFCYCLPCLVSLTILISPRIQLIGLYWVMPTWDRTIILNQQKASTLSLYGGAYSSVFSYVFIHLFTLLDDIY